MAEDMANETVHDRLYAWIGRISTESSPAAVTSCCTEALIDLLDAEAGQFHPNSNGTDGRTESIIPDDDSRSTLDRTAIDVAQEAFESKSITETQFTAVADEEGAEEGSIFAIPIGDSGVVTLRLSDPPSLDETCRDRLELMAWVADQAVAKYRAIDANRDWNEPTEEVPTCIPVTMVFGPDGRIEHLNPRAVSVLEPIVGTVIGASLDELSIVEPEAVRESIRKVLETDDRNGVSRNVSLRFRDRERTTPVRMSGQLSRSERGDTGEARVIFTGTIVPCLVGPTDTWTGERPLQKLVEHFPNGLVTLFDEDFRFRLAGGELFDMLDLDRSEVIGRRLSEVFPPENVARVKPLYEAAFEGEANRVELTFQGREFRVHVVPVYDDAGNVQAGMTMSQDVTEERERERLLKRTREKYRTLVEAAPDAIFLGNVETGELVEMNQAAAELLEADPEELLGENHTVLHPPEDSDRYLEEFARHAELDGTKSRYLGDSGDQMYVLTISGERIPVEISTKTIVIDGSEMMFGIFRDISEQVRFEQTLRELHAASADLLEAESRMEIGHIVVDTATEILDLSLVSVNVYNEAIGTLEPIAYSPDVEELLEHTRALGLKDSIAGRAFLSGETVACEDVRTDPDVNNPDTIVRSQIIVPIGEFGVFICGDTEPDRFEQTDIELAELLLQTAEAAFHRTKREQSLRKRELELEQQTTFLEGLESINTAIRRITQIAIDAETRMEVERSVCDAMIEESGFAFSWIGELDPVQNNLVPRATSGGGEGYLDRISLRIDTENGDPALEAARTGSIVERKNLATDPRDSEWRQVAIERGFLSGLALPITYKDMRYGVLTIYADEPNAFSGMIRSVLGELADITAYSLNAVERKHALLTHQTTELELDIRSTDCYFLRLARETGCSLAFDGLIPHDDGDASIFLRVTEGSLEKFDEFCENASVVEGVRRISDDSGGVLYQIRFADRFIGSMLANYGIILTSITADTDAARVRVAVAPTFSVHRATEIIMNHYTEVEFIAKELSEQPIDRSVRFPDRYLEELTDRQEQAIQLAYLSGYYETPKKITGKDLADMMGISSTAFHNHLRIAEQKLVSAVFENHHVYSSDVE